MTPFDEIRKGAVGYNQPAEGAIAPSGKLSDYVGTRPKEPNLDWILRAIEHEDCDLLMFHRMYSSDRPCYHAAILKQDYDEHGTECGGTNLFSCEEPSAKEMLRKIETFLRERMPEYYHDWCMTCDPKRR